VQKEAGEEVRFLIAEDFCRFGDAGMSLDDRNEFKAEYFKGAINACDEQELEEEVSRSGKKRKAASALATSPREKRSKRAASVLATEKLAQLELESEKQEEVAGEVRLQNVHVVAYVSMVCV
jgi:hypothetical protein